jgi:hypothetical protein
LSRSTSSILPAARLARDNKQVQDVMACTITLLYTHYYLGVTSPYTTCQNRADPTLDRTTFWSELSLVAPGRDSSNDPLPRFFSPVIRGRQQLVPTTSTMRLDTGATPRWASLGLLLVLAQLATLVTASFVSTDLRRAANVSHSCSSYYCTCLAQHTPSMNDHISDPY